MQMIIAESPLADIEIHGIPLDNNYGGSFSDLDRRYIKQSILKKVYYKKLGKLPFNLFIYILNASGLDHLGKDYPEGVFVPRLVKNKIDIPIDDLLNSIKVNKGKDPKAVHFIMGDNYSETNQILPTSWILVHRLMHAVDPVDNAYGKPPKLNTGDFQDFLTMKSAAASDIHESELNAEIATQYFITGDIPLKPKNETVTDTEYSKIQEFVVNFKKVADRRAKDIEGKTFYI